MISGTHESKDGTRRVKDILTPLGAAPHPPRSLALAANHPFAIIPQASGGDIPLPDPPRAQNFLKQWQNSASRIKNFRLSSPI
jgi:hypothetical protein